MQLNLSINTYGAGKVLFGPAEIFISREVGVAEGIWSRRDTLFPPSCRVWGHLGPLRYLFPAKLGMYGGDGGVLCTFVGKLWRI